MNLLINLLFTIPCKQFCSVKNVTESIVFYLSEAAKTKKIKPFLLVSKSNHEYWKNVCGDSAETVVWPFATENKILRVLYEQIACHWAVKKVKADIFYSSSGALPYFKLPCKTLIFLQNIFFFHFNEYSGQKQLRISFVKWLIQYKLWHVYSYLTCIHSIKDAQEIIVGSGIITDEICKYTKINTAGKRFHVIPCGINDIFHEEFKAERPFDKPYILSISHILPYKNFEDCIKIFALLKSKYKIPHHLIIIGDGPQEYVKTLHELADMLNVGEFVKFAGIIPHRNLPSWYSFSDLLIYTSFCESLGLPVLEAMACNVPVIASDKSGIPDTVKGYGMLENPSETGKFAEKAYMLLTDKKIKNSMVKEAKKYSEQFTWKRYAERITDIMVNEYKDSK